MWTPWWLTSAPPATRWSRTPTPQRPPTRGASPYAWLPGRNWEPERRGQHAPTCRGRPAAGVDPSRPWSTVPDQKAHPRFLPAVRYPLTRSEEHTSELQSRPHLVCRLLLEKKNT